MPSKKAAQPQSDLSQLDIFWCFYAEAEKVRLQSLGVVCTEIVYAFVSRDGRILLRTTSAPLN